MCALTALCSVYCVVSIKQTQRLQTGLCLCDRNAIITSKWKGCYDFDRKYRSEWERLLCRKLLVDQYTNSGTISAKLCNFTNHEKTGKISVPVSAKQDLIFISKKMFFDIFDLDVFVAKEWQYRKKSLFFFWPLNRHFGLFLAAF